MKGTRLGKSEIANGEILTVDQTLRRIEAVNPSVNAVTGLRAALDTLFVQSSWKT